MNIANFLRKDEYFLFGSLNLLYHSRELEIRKSIARYSTEFSVGCGRFKKL